MLPALSARDVRRFVTFPDSIYRDDPQWVPPIRSDVARRLDVERNPFYATARRQLFLAWLGGDVVGTVAAIIDDARNAEVAEAVGYFGFLEAVDSDDVVEELLESASQWLTAAGAGTIRGPINGSSSDEIGLLIEGFGTAACALAGTPSAVLSGAAGEAAADPVRRRPGLRDDLCGHRRNDGQPS